MWFPLNNSLINNLLRPLQKSNWLCMFVCFSIHVCFMFVLCFMFVKKNERKNNWKCDCLEQLTHQQSASASAKIKLIMYVCLFFYSCLFFIMFVLCLWKKKWNSIDYLCLFVIYVCLFMFVVLSCLLIQANIHWIVFFFFFFK